MIRTINCHPDASRTLTVLLLTAAPSLLMVFVAVGCVSGSHAVVFPRRQTHGSYNLLERLWTDYRDQTCAG